MQAIIEDVERTGPRRSFRLVLPLRHHRCRRLDRRGARLRRDARAPRPERAHLLSPPRARTSSRKAGNIADFVTRWGGAYDAHARARRRQPDDRRDDRRASPPRWRPIPTPASSRRLPLIINRNTLFARAAAVRRRASTARSSPRASPPGSGRDGNYWGHNAIIRTPAFADHCGLPDLPGKPPFGGHILSHDFVEAALIRRAGWAVYMLPTLGGSYEESPPSLIDLADARPALVPGQPAACRASSARRASSLATRQHFATGIMGYLASPLWLAQLLVGIVLVLQSHYIRPEYFTARLLAVSRPGRGSTPSARCSCSS